MCIWFEFHRQPPRLPYAHLSCTHDHLQLQSCKPLVFWWWYSHSHPRYHFHFLRSPWSRLALQIVRGVKITSKSKSNQNQSKIKRKCANSISNFTSIFTTIKVCWFYANVSTHLICHPRIHPSPRTVSVWKWRNNGLHFIVAISTSFSALAAELRSMQTKPKELLFTFSFNAHMPPVIEKIPSLNVILTVQWTSKIIVSFSYFPTLSEIWKVVSRQRPFNTVQFRQAPHQRPGSLKPWRS